MLLFLKFFELKLAEKNDNNQSFIHNFGIKIGSEERGVSGLVGKRVDVPDPGEVNNPRVGIWAWPRALASRGSSLLRGFRDGSGVVVVFSDRHLTLSSELAPIRWIRLSN